MGLSPHAKMPNFAAEKKIKMFAAWNKKSGFGLGGDLK